MSFELSNRSWARAFIELQASASSSNSSPAAAPQCGRLSFLAPGGTEDSFCWQLPADVLPVATEGTPPGNVTQAVPYFAWQCSSVAHVRVCATICRLMSESPV